MSSQIQLSKSLLRRNYASIPGLHKPEWLKVKISNSNINQFTKDIVSINRLTTVCEEAACPNIHECWSKKHATFMILGDTCTRSCTFCNVKTGMPEDIDIFEPARVANAVLSLKLDHVVITSVDRDDLLDGGALQFAKVINSIKKKSPLTTIEILTPDFYKKSNALDILSTSPFEIFNHNMETVKRLYRDVRPGANFIRSLTLLKKVKVINPKIFTKSGIMIGLGEEYDEILSVMDSLLDNDVDFLTIGQYLRPTKFHHPVIHYHHPDYFKQLEYDAYKKGFKLVSSSPFTRSSFHADDDFKKLKAFVA
ncbi:lipoyl synthase [Pelagibacterales bacterium]|nr:lipoyl synthase [Pelagibacterales bacterium]